MIARASEWTAHEVRQAVRGDLAGIAETRFRGISTDTRDALQQQLFVAIRGDRFDAHDFLERAVDGGAAGLLVEANRVDSARLERLSTSASVVIVPDTIIALGALAQAHRRRLHTPVLALTGSNGKTTTKEMVAAIFATSRSVLKTAGNLNNLIGGPMTLLGLTAAHEVAVMEMGMNAPGEIARLAAIAEPHAGLVTNVGPAHIGELGSIEAIASAKGELYQALTRLEGVAVVNADDPLVIRAVEDAGTVERRTFGAAKNADVRLLDTNDRGDHQDIELELDGSRLSVSVPYPGRHNAMNAAAAIALATASVRSVKRPSDEEIITGLAAAAKIAGRLQLEASGDLRLVDDCYNANAASMLAAIDTVATQVANTGGRLVALLGEMRELGEFSNGEHARVGAAAAENGAVLVGAFGPLASPIAEAAAVGGVDAHHVRYVGVAMWRGLELHREPGDIVLVKGSRGIKMERFLERLRKRAG